MPVAANKRSRRCGFMAFLLWPVHILLIEPSLLVAEVHRTARDEELPDLRLRLERIAVGEHNIGYFALLEGPKPVCDAPNFGGAESDGAERFLPGQTEGDRRRGLIGKVARELIAKRPKRELDAGLI